MSGMQNIDRSLGQVRLTTKTFDVLYKPYMPQINHIDPDIELYRYHLMNDTKNLIMKKFMEKDFYISENQLKNKIKFNDMVVRWLFGQKASGYCSIDPILPYNAAEFTQLRMDMHLMNGNKNLKITEKYVEDTLKYVNVTELFNTAVDKMEKYARHRGSPKTVVTIRRTGKEYLMNTKSQYDIEVRINGDLYEKLKKSYLGERSEMERMIYCLMVRYFYTLKSENHQLGVNPLTLIKFREDLAVNFELFASPVNRTLEHFCSMFYDIDRYFGSKGSFFDLEILSGNFEANPPFDDDVMTHMTKHLIKYLKGDGNMSIVITIPIWDYETLKELGVYQGDGDNIYSEIRYKTLDTIKESGFMKYIKVVPREGHSYFDSRLCKYISVTNTYVILMANNDDMDLQKLEKLINKM